MSPGAVSGDMDAGSSKTMRDNQTTSSRVRPPKDRTRLRRQVLGQAPPLLLETTVGSTISGTEVTETL